MAQTKKRPAKKPQRAEEAPVCPVAICPVGLLLTASGQARPEVVEHLMNAGREFVLALTALLAARVGEVEAPARLEKIDVE